MGQLSAISATLSLTSTFTCNNEERELRLFERESSQRETHAQTVVQTKLSSSVSLEAQSEL